MFHLQEHRVSASVARLSEADFLALELSLRAAVGEIYRKITELEARGLPKLPSSVVELMAYCEHGVRRIISSFTLVRNFHVLPLEMKKTFFQVRGFYTIFFVY